MAVFIGEPVTPSATHPRPQLACHVEETAESRHEESFLT